jgi:hypothetical protein
MKGDMKRFLRRFRGRSSRREEALTPFRLEPRDLGCNRVPTAALLPLIWTFAVCTAWAQGTTGYVPNNLANVEGNTSVNDFLNSSSFRMQMVFDVSQFAGLPEGPNISNSVTSIDFRLDGGSTHDVVYFFGGASVTLSTTPRTPDSMSPVFAENVGPDAVTVFLGALGMGNTYQPGVTPQPFDTMIIATTPFFYSPSKGNLLVDIRAGSGFIQIPGAFDAQGETGDSVSRVFAGAAGATAGTPDSLGLVTRFNITVIPEPSTIVLVVTGLTLLAIFRRR